MILTMISAIALGSAVPATTAPAADYSREMPPAEDEAQAEAVPEGLRSDRYDEAVRQNVERVRREIEDMKRPRVVPAREALEVEIVDRRPARDVVSPSVGVPKVAATRAAQLPSAEAGVPSRVVYAGLSAIVAIAIALTAIAIALWRKSAWKSAARDN